MSAIKPVIPLPSNLFFPQEAIIPLNVVRDLSVKAAKHALKADGVLLFLVQKERETATPHPEDLHRVGIVGKIIDSYDPQDGTIRIAFKAESRATALRCFEENGYLQAEVEIIPEAKTRSKKAKALMERAVDAFEKYLVKMEQQPLPEFVLIKVGEDGITLEVKPATVNTADKILEAMSLMKMAIHAFEKYLKASPPSESIVSVQVTKDGTIGTVVKRTQEEKPVIQIVSYPQTTKVTRAETMRLAVDTRVAGEILQNLRKIDRPGHLADSIARHMNIGSEQLQRVLDEADPMKRLQVVVELLEEEGRS